MIDALHRLAAPHADAADFWMLQLTNASGIPLNAGRPDYPTAAQAIDALDAALAEPDSAVAWFGLLAVFDGAERIVAAGDRDAASGRFVVFAGE